MTQKKRYRIIIAYVVQFPKRTYQVGKATGKNTSCMYIHMDVHIHVYVHVDVHVHTHRCMHVCKYLSTNFRHFEKFQFSSSSLEFMYVRMYVFFYKFLKSKF
jgi:hypothetical protein